MRPASTGALGCSRFFSITLKISPKAGHTFRFKFDVNFSKHIFGAEVLRNGTLPKLLRLRQHIEFGPWRPPHVLVDESRRKVSVASGSVPARSGAPVSCGARRETCDSARMGCKVSCSGGCEDTLLDTTISLVMRATRSKHIEWSTICD